MVVYHPFSFMTLDEAWGEYKMMKACAKMKGERLIFWKEKAEELEQRVQQLQEVNDKCLMKGGAIAVTYERKLKAVHDKALEVYEEEVRKNKELQGDNRLLFAENEKLRRVCQRLADENRELRTLLQKNGSDQHCSE